MAIQTELVGHIDCPVCSQQGQKKRAEVRKGKRKLIIDCPVHSTLSMQGGTGQKFIRENMVKISEKPAPDKAPAESGDRKPVPEKVQKPDQKPDQKKPEPRKRWSLFGSFGK